MSGRADRLPPPGHVQRDLRDLIETATQLVTAYEEAYEYGLTARMGGSLALTSGSGWSKGESNDPTGQTVISADLRRIRGATRGVVRSIDRAGRELTGAHRSLMEAFLDTDPDLRADRLAKRRAATEGYSATP